MDIKYGFGKTLNVGFDKAVEQVIGALKTEGFGVLTDIDIAATLKEKLGEEVPPYRILGACNPPLAHQALIAEPWIGLLLPCNVVIRQDEKGAVQVGFMDPAAVLNLVQRPDIEKLADQVKSRIENVLNLLT